MKNLTKTDQERKYFNWVQAKLNRIEESLNYQYDNVFFDSINITRDCLFCNYTVINGVETKYLQIKSYKEANSIHIYELLCTMG